MKEIRLIPIKEYSSGFLPQEFIPKGSDEHSLRNAQNPRPEGYWRRVTNEEIRVLESNGNTCESWDNFLVRDPFEPGLITGSRFYGLVRLGRVESVALEHHDLRVPAGISNSLILSCDIGDDCSIRNVAYLAHYIIGNNCMLLNIDELHTTNHAKFGNGIIKDGEKEDVRIWLELVNEAGGREVMPFDGMIPADAYIWLRYREDDLLQKKLKQITQARFDSRRGYYGVIGESSVVKNSAIIKDVLMGSHCYVKGANKLKNLTINSSEDEPTQIGEGVELVNGIVGYQCRIFYGCKAVRFVMGRNSNLKYGARLIHSFLGDNSTVSCCEILHNLIFPAHEQHHNNSFLTASCVLGQSNIAAGATVGSNHNSRANDGEILAGRGFWPGLCVTLKHSCRFASFVLLSKGDYPAEMHIPLPFSLVSDDRSRNELNIMPAFFWMHNMYALERNTWKFTDRDKRKVKAQKIEFDSLAPDTIEEIFTAMDLLATWTAKAFLAKTGEKADSKTRDELVRTGSDLIEKKPERIKDLEITGEDIEYSRRKVLILKPIEGYHAYADMLFYYAMKNIVEFMVARPDAGLSDVKKELGGTRVRSWVNLGGQLVREEDCSAILERVKNGAYDTWDKIHAAYDGLYESYGLAKQKHAFATLVTILGERELSDKTWGECLDRAVSLQEYVRDQVYLSRKKDFDNPIRKKTFRNDEEMRAVRGTAEDNSFVKLVRNKTEEYKRTIEGIRKRK